MRSSDIEKNTKKKKIKLPLSAYLIYLLIATFMFTGVSLSKYATSAEGSDGVRVAVMEAGMTIESFTFTGYPGQRTAVSEAIPVTITNFSGEGDSRRVCEVSMAYTVIIDNVLENIPLEFYVYSDKECTVPVTLSDTDVQDTEAVFTGMFEAAVAENFEFYIIIEWPDGYYTSSDSFEVDALRIIVKSEQID